MASMQALQEALGFNADLGAVLARATAANRLYLYGTGEMGKLLCWIIESIRPDLMHISFIDSNRDGTLGGRRIYSLSSYVEVASADDIVLIASSFEDEIVENLARHGIRSAVRCKEWLLPPLKRSLGTAAKQLGAALWRQHPRGDYFLQHGGLEQPPPIRTSIALTNKCNLRCEICGSQKYLDDTGTRRRHMDVVTVKAVAETLFPFLITVELNSQGDPLLYPEIADVLQLIAHHRCELKLQTNGTLLTDRVIDFLTQQYGEVNLSLDAVGPKFDEVRRGGNWSKAEPGLEKFLATRDPRKLAVGLYPTVTKRTIDEGLNILNWAAEHGVDSVTFHRYWPIAGSFEEAPSEAEYDDMRGKLRGWAARNGGEMRIYFESECLNQDSRKSRKSVFASPEKQLFKALYAPFDFPFEQDQPGADADFICSAPNTILDIGLDGQISACCRSQDVPLGYATSVEAFADAWFGRNYKRIRSSLRRGATGPYPLPNCEACVIFHAPNAAGSRKAISYGSASEASSDALEFVMSEDVRVEGISIESGHCYRSKRLPPGIPADAFELWEDDRLLGPSKASRDEIRAEGRGRYSIEGRVIHFAASDNTDPRRNLRTYMLRRKKMTA